MNKIKALIEQDWTICFRTYKIDTVFWYGVEAYHNSYKDVEIYKKTLASALNEMVKQIKKLEPINQ